MVQIFSKTKTCDIIYITFIKVSHSRLYCCTELRFTAMKPTCTEQIKLTTCSIQKYSPPSQSSSALHWSCPDSLSSLFEWFRSDACSTKTLHSDVFVSNT